MGGREDQVRCLSGTKPGQRLVAHDLPAGQLDDRLVDRPERSITEDAGHRIPELDCPQMRVQPLAEQCAGRGAEVEYRPDVLDEPAGKRAVSCPDHDATLDDPTVHDRAECHGLQSRRIELRAPRTVLGRGFPELGPWPAPREPPELARAVRREAVADPHRDRAVGSTSPAGRPRRAQGRRRWR